MIRSMVTGRCRRRPSERLPSEHEEMPIKFKMHGCRRRRRSCTSLTIDWRFEASEDDDEEEEDAEEGDDPAEDPDKTLPLVRLEDALSIEEAVSNGAGYGSKFRMRFTATRPPK